MSEFTYSCNINKKEILGAIKNHEYYDTWGEVEYGNDKRAVDYNIYIDGTDEEGWDYIGAFYRLYADEDGVWHHDDCCELYEYTIDFKDKDWEAKLKEAAQKAYEALWEE